MATGLPHPISTVQAGVKREPSQLSLTGNVGGAGGAARHPHAGSQLCVVPASGSGVPSAPSVLYTESQHNLSQHPPPLSPDLLFILGQSHVKLTE